MRRWLSGPWTSTPNPGPCGRGSSRSAPTAAASYSYEWLENLPDEALVLQVGDVRAGRPIHRDEQLRWESTWSFVVRPAPGGRSRLLVRERAGFGSRLTELAMSPVGFISFAMTQKMLREIKVRAEAASGTVHGVGAGAGRCRP